MKKFKISLKTTSFAKDVQPCTAEEDKIEELEQQQKHLRQKQPLIKEDNSDEELASGPILGLVGPSKKKAKTVSDVKEKEKEPPIKETKKKEAKEQKVENTDYKVYVSDLGPDVTDSILEDAFKKFGTVTKATVVRDRKSKISKGFGFVFFSEASHFLHALRSANGLYVGGRPIRVKRSTRDW